MSTEQHSAATIIGRWFRERQRKQQLIYELRFEGREERYVGSTRVGSRARLCRHIRDGRDGISYALYVFMREVGLKKTSMHILRYVGKDENLEELETERITEIGSKHPLLNIRQNIYMRGKSKALKERVAKMGESEESREEVREDTTWEIKDVDGSKGRHTWRDLCVASEIQEGLCAKQRLVWEEKVRIHVNSMYGSS